MSKLKTLFSCAITLSSLAFFPQNSVASEVDLSARSDQDMQQDMHRKPAEVIKLVGVKSGDKVIDLLAGGGYYSEILSRVVGDNGEVVLQIPEAYLAYVGKELEQRLADNRLKNVRYLQSEEQDLQIANENFDSAFLILGYHDMFFTDKGWSFTPDTVMPQVLASLKKGGKLLVIDHNAAADRNVQDAKTLHRIEENFVVNDIEKRGFKLIKRSALLKNKNDNYQTSVFNEKLRRKTDRFILLFEKQ